MYENESKVSPTCLNKDCSFHTCIIRKSQDIKNATAVIFNANDLSNILPPNPRNSEQVWILHIPSPDVNIFESDLIKWNNLFNWTMGYTHNSDFFEKMEVFDIKVSKDVQMISFVTVNNSHSISWIISNCFYFRYVIPDKGFFSTSHRYLPTKSDAGNVRANDIHLTLDSDGNIPFSLNVLSSRINKGCCKSAKIQEQYKNILLGRDNERTLSLFKKQYSVLDVAVGIPTESTNMPEGTYAYIDPIIDTVSFTKQLNWSLIQRRPLVQSLLKYFKVGRKSQLCEVCKQLHDSSIHRKSYADIVNWVFS